MENQKRAVGPVTVATGGAAAIVQIIAWGAREFAGIDIPADVQGSLTVAIVLAVGWLVRPRHKGKRAAS